MRGRPRAGDVVSVSVTVAASPYKGLVPFGDSDLDALFFFGREREVEVISANLVASRLTVLYGPTGVGKSSVLRAGVVRGLRAVPFPRQVVVFDSWTDTPGRRLTELVATAAQVDARASFAETLADAGAALDGELYVVLDQLEEYFVYHGGAAEPGSFTDELADALTQSGVRANVLLCLREDALAKLDVLKTRVPGLFSNYLRLDHLGRDAARSAILGPVERWNELFAAGSPVTVEPELVDAVLDQVETGTLGRARSGRAVTVRGGGGSTIEAPYLQLVLERLWEVERASGSSVLRHETLTELGGAASIVGDHLVRALRELSPAEKETSAGLFHHLVTPSGTKIAHTVPDLARYAGADEDAVRTVARKLVAERILRTVAGASGGEPRLEIFHDVLAGAVLDWGTRFEAQRDEAKARRAAEVRHRKATLVAVAAVAALLVVGAVAVFALAQRSSARTHERGARASELVAQALLLQTTDPGTALERALAATRLEATPQTEAVLRSSLTTSRLRLAVRLGSPVGALTWVGPGLVAAGSADGRVRLWRTSAGRVVGGVPAGGPVSALLSAANGGPLLAVAGGALTGWDAATLRRRFSVHEQAPIVAAALGAGGTLVATAGNDGVSVRDVRDGAVRSRIDAQGAVDVAFAPDGRTILVVRRDADGHLTPWLYDAASGGPIAHLAQRGLRAVAFSPDSRLVATGSADGTTMVWRTAGGGLVRVLYGSKNIDALAFRPDGAMLATGSADGGVRVWRLSDGTRFFLFVGHRAAVRHVTFSPDGDYLASGSDDGTTRIWIVGGTEAGRQAALLAGAGSVTAVAYSPGGHSLVTAGEDGVARLWEPRIEQQLTAVADDHAPGEAVRVREPGDTLVTVAGGFVRERAAAGVRALPLRGRVFALAPSAVATAADRSVVVEAIPSGTRVTTLEAPAPVAALAFRADARQLVAAAGGAVLVWELPSGRLLHRFSAPRATRVAIAPRGDVVLTGSASGTARLWSVSGSLLHVLRFHHAPITDARFDPSGGRVATASEGTSDNAAEWDARTGDLLHGLVGHFGTVTAISFSPDGRWLLTAGPIAAAIWDAGPGELLFYLRGPTALLTDAEWAPVGYLVATTERDGIVREYRCQLCEPLGALQAIAAERIAAAG